MKPRPFRNLPSAELQEEVEGLEKRVESALGLDVHIHEQHKRRTRLMEGIARDAIALLRRLSQRSVAEGAAHASKVGCCLPAAPAPAGPGKEDALLRALMDISNGKDVNGKALSAPELRRIATDVLSSRT